MAGDRRPDTGSPAEGAGERAGWRLAGRRLRYRRRWALLLLGAALAAAAVPGAPYAWIRLTASGHLYDEPAPGSPATVPPADVVMVLGAQVAPGGTAPMPYLRGRLDTAAALVRSGRARVILVSGDGHGSSGDEITVMTGYLTGTAGIGPARVVGDPDGLDTYDSCLRARSVYGVRRLIVVTQAFHLPRAVALCRHAGIDTDGVRARCGDCNRLNWARNTVRDYIASTKVAVDVLSGRGPAVTSPPSDAVRRAGASG